MDYLVERMRKYAARTHSVHNEKSNLFEFADQLAGFFEFVEAMPRYLVPCYFDLVITRVHARLVFRNLSLK
jgi:hypothetical protein